MRTHSAALLVSLIAGTAVAAELPRTPMMGHPASQAEIDAWDISIAPDGAGLPPGQGNVEQGRELYAQLCQTCHNEAGKGQPADRLTGGVGTLSSAAPVKTVASFWPYATTLFDYVRRAMPLHSPQSLKDDQVYALVAYLLSVDGIVPATATLDAPSLVAIRMPNRDGFAPWPSNR
ncbi:MAG TPA: cytochrome c [Acetobacteraceae bacterium]|nr:cytochrome c [Acetobacteraceae bacterium]